MPALVEQGKEGLEVAEGAGVLTPPTGDASDTAGSSPTGEWRWRRKVRRGNAN